MLIHISINITAHDATATRKSNAAATRKSTATTPKPIKNGNDDDTFNNNNNDHELFKNNNDGFKNVMIHLKMLIMVDLIWFHWCCNYRIISTMKTIKK
ncbi:MAG: hypothetical protein GY739_19815 [Mesoflavibacter sp.]|nr:hypothetical protein [Mesoflavibacter sp.]